MLNEEIMAKSAVVICDRTLIDVYAYTYRLDKELAAAIEPLVTYWCKSYDALFFMEPNPVYDLKDGIRSTDKAFQDEIDKYIKGVLVKHHIETFPISLGLITWAEIIKKIIKEK
jgi:hypothetical protein